MEVEPSLSVFFERVCECVNVLLLVSCGFVDRKACVVNDLKLN